MWPGMVDDPELSSSLYDKIGNATSGTEQILLKYQNNLYKEYQLYYLQYVVKYRYHKFILFIKWSKQTLIAFTSWINLDGYGSFRTPSLFATCMFCP